MDNNLQDISRFDALIDRFAHIKEKYGDIPPIILFEPNIETQEKIPLKSLIGGITCIELFQEIQEAFRFVQSLDTSFVLLFTNEYNEQIILQNFKDLGFIMNGRMPFSEEEGFFEIIGISSPSIVKSLKAFPFISPLDFLTEVFFSEFDGVIEWFAEIKEKYGDQYPLVFYEPNIEVPAKQDLKKIIEETGSIQLFSELESAEKYIQSLGISFVLIFSREYNEHMLLQPFQSLEFAYSRRMFDFEEEAFLKEVFKEAPDCFRKSLKVYVFVTLLDFLVEPLAKEDDEEIMMMCDVNKMAQDFRQEFTLVCYDPLMNSETREKLEKNVEILIHQANCYNDFDELQKRLKDWKDCPPYHLIISGETEANKIIDQIDDFNDLVGLYAYCDSSLKINNEKIDVERNLKDLIPKIKEGIRTRSKLKHTFPAFATNFDALDKSHIYNTHHYLKGLIHFNNRKQAKEDFLKLARKIYQDKENELIKFEQSYLDYDKQEILTWYTRDSPIYKLINNCLRISSLDSILYCRFILKDLETAIREEYRRKSMNFDGEVYRGAYLSAEEWEKLQRNVGEEIEMYGFLSTTTEKKAALNFLKADLQNKVLITIIVPPLSELDEQGFADISEFSEFKGENEILFNVRSRLKILQAEVSKVDGRLPKCRHLVLFYGAQCLRKYITKNKPTIQIRLTLPSEIKCDFCGSKDSLFAFRRFDPNTHICCKNCLKGDSLPRNNLLLALEGDMKAGQVIRKSFKGKFLLFDQKVNLPFSCFDCKKTGVRKHYKRIALDGSKMISQCIDCFEKNQKREFEILLIEESPFIFWQEEQKELEEIDSDYQEESRQRMICGQDDLYKEVQEYNLCRKYGESVTCKWSKKRDKEGERLRMFRKIGEAHYDLENNQKALKYLLQTLEIQEAIFGEKYSENPFLYNLLSLVYTKLGEHQKALDYHKKAVDTSTVIYGPNTATLYKGAGMIYIELGEYQRAFECCFKTLQTDEEIYGEQHPQTAFSYYNLGLVYEKLGELQQALKYHQRALDIRKAIYGEKHRLTALSYDSIAVVLRMLGKYQQALDYLTKALGVFRDLSGEKDPYTANVYDHLGVVYKDLGQKQLAMEHFFKAFEIRKTIYGEQHPETPVSYNNLASVYESLGEHQQALEYFLKALDILKDIYGEKYPTIATISQNIGRVYQNLGQYQRALEYQIEAFNIFKENYGEKHHSLVHSYINFGRLYQELKQYQKALDYSQKGLDICVENYGENHDLTATLYEDIGYILQKLGYKQQVPDYWEKTLQIRKIVFGEKHLYTAKSYNNTAKSYQELGQYQQALDYHKRALDIFRDVCGETYANTADSYTEIVIIYKKLGQNEEAEEYLAKGKEALEIKFGRSF